jgi:hypothetical protein
MRRPEFDFHEWQFRDQFDVQPGDNISNHSEKFITEFLDKIKGAAPRIRELSKDHDVLILLVYSVHDIPYIGLTRDHIDVIASIGARLDYDIMVDDANPKEDMASRGRA